MLTVVPSGDLWQVRRGDVVVAETPTNREAWRLVDQLTAQPLSRQEHVHDWSFREAALAS